MHIRFNSPGLTITLFLLFMCLVALAWLNHVKMLDAQDKLNGAQIELQSSLEVLAQCQSEMWSLMMELDECKKAYPSKTYKKIGNLLGEKWLQHMDSISRGATLLPGEFITGDAAIIMEYWVDNGIPDSAWKKHGKKVSGGTSGIH